MTLAELSRDTGVPTSVLEDWHTDGVRYHGHTERLLEYSEEALHSFIRRCPHHLSVIVEVDPRVWRAAVCEQAGYPAVPEEAERRREALPVVEAYQ